MTNDVQLIGRLLNKMEGDDLEFKRDQYRLDSPEQKSELIKDVVCMANTPRAGSGYIVIGVATENGRPTEVVGVTVHPDPAELQRILAAQTAPTPRFSYRIVPYEGAKQIGLLEIPADRNVPVVIRNTYGVLRKGAVYLRRNTECAAGDQQDILRIVRWAEPSQNEEAGTSGISASWETLYRLCDGFDQRQAFVAVLPRSPELSQDDWNAFASLGWHLVIDLDLETDTDGGYSKAGPELAKIRSLRLTALDDIMAETGVGSSVWVAALGLTSRPSTIRSHTWREWNQSKARTLDRWVIELARVTEPQPTTALILGGEHSYVQSVCDMLDQAFGGRLTLVFATPSPTTYSAIIEKLNASEVAIRVTEICAGIRDVRKSLPETMDIELPKLGGGSMLVPPERARWVEEELEIVHLGAGISPADPSIELRDFLRGLPITWYGLNVRVDIDRRVTNGLETRLRRELESRDTRRVNLFGEYPLTAR
ncbi:MAG: transcriptional regulator [Dehalococcoidia bacterium]|nr:transcriptional regulator [Dehalococcoidia bacterium]